MSGPLLYADVWCFLPCLKINLAGFEAGSAS